MGKLYTTVDVTIMILSNKKTNKKRTNNNDKKQLTVVLKVKAINFQEVWSQVVLG